MRKKFVPIIGTISAGKSTFLQALLGTSVLQSGSTTTTKFVCLIQNSNQTKFYHVVPKKENGIKFVKSGEEIIGEEKIKQKIEDINKDLSEKPGTKDDIFYTLEIPIKNFDNPSILKECYFMDIPGLNENKSSYVEIIFSLLTLEDIKFEIMVFDSTNIGSDGILKIIKRLDAKKCLKKEGNLFILNRIDEVTQNGEDDIINSFKQYFYQNFEDEKKNDLLLININENRFVPMNSLLYLAETKMDEDFYSFLVYEFFNFIDPTNKGQLNSFYDFLINMRDISIKNLNDQNKSIDLNVKKITKEEEEIISKSIDELEKIKNKTNTNCFLNIKLNKSKKNEIYKIFLLHKNKAFIKIHTKYFIELQQVIKDLGKDVIDFSCPPPSHINIPKSIEIKKLKKEDSIVNSNVMDIKALDELENFLKITFKKIDPNNELESFRISLQNLREGIIGRKLRIAFIGNISVGKSSVLNSIIGEDILPTNDKECTYRGIIIRHAPGQIFKLYKTKLVTRGKGNGEYYYFEDDKSPYCQTIRNIKSHLNNKNNDKKINDNDAYLVVTGPLRIFEFIKLDKDIMSNIEFIDLPGPDRDNNIFNEKLYYKKILRFSNCCVYINEPKSIDDEKSVNMMVNQYEKDKLKIFPKFRAGFLRTCLFLFNKSDKIEKNQDKLKLESSIIKNISIVEKNFSRNDLNISYFSGKYFLKYLKAFDSYVFLLEKYPGQLFLNLYNKYCKNYSRFFKGFKTFIMDKIAKVEENFYLDDLGDENAPDNFINNMKSQIKNFENICKYKLINDEDYDEVIEALYNLNKKLKGANFSGTQYSHEFFDDLKRAIQNSERLNKENFQKSVKDFFSDADILFRKELKKGAESKKLEKKRDLINLGNVKQIIQNNFILTKSNLKKLFEEAKKDVLELIDSELSNISERLKEANKDLNEATKRLKAKIEVVIENLKTKQKEEFAQLMKKIEKEIEKKLEEKEIKFASSDIDTNKGFTAKMIISLIASTISGIAIRTGLAMIGESILAGAAAGAASTTIGAAAAGAVAGPVGIAIGVGVGLTISLATLLVHVFSKEKRYEKGLKDFRIKMESDMDESENNCFEDFKTFEEEFTSAFEQKTSAIQKEITNIDQEQWEELKKEYAEHKNKIMKKIGSLEI